MDKIEETKADAEFVPPPAEAAPPPPAEAASEQPAPAEAPGIPPIPVGLVPFNAIPCVFLVFPIPGAIATNRAGEQVRVCAIQVHTPAGVQTYATDERSVSALGDRCREVVGSGISIAPANALDMLMGRARRPR